MEGRGRARRVRPRSRSSPRAGPRSPIHNYCQYLPRTATISVVIRPRITGRTIRSLCQRCTAPRHADATTRRTSSSPIGGSIWRDTAGERRATVCHADGGRIDAGMDTAPRLGVHPSPRAAWRRAPHRALVGLSRAAVLGRPALGGRAGPGAVADRRRSRCPMDRSTYFRTDTILRSGSRAGALVVVVIAD